MIACAATALLTAGAHPAWAQEEDPFVRQRDAEAAKNRSSGFSISFVDDRRAFRPGETITLKFTFSRHDISPFSYERCRGLGNAEAVLDHSDGTADPQADLSNNGIVDSACGLIGGVIGGIVGGDGRPQAQPPIEFTINLNQAVRFDRPGRYRFYASSGHLFLGQGPVPRLISNILELEILERDPDWERRTLEDAIRILDTPADQRVRKDAARAISYLATPAAVDEMARRIFRVRPQWGGGVSPAAEADFDWLRGLYGARDRLHVVEQLEQELDRSDRYISPRFITQLSLLDATRRSAARPIDRARFDELVRSYSTRHFAALKAADLLREELEKAFRAAAEHRVSIRMETLAAGMAQFPEDVEAALAVLSPKQQRVMLTNDTRSWTALSHPAFIPLLRRLTNGTSPEGPQDLALRLLGELAPREARRIALRELRKRDSVVGASGLSVLPDHPLPGLDGALVRSLQEAKTSEQFGRAMARIERFATGRRVGNVQRVYEQFPGGRGCRLGPVALAYFFRVAPAYARREIDRVMQEVHAGEPCDAGVLPVVAELRMGSDVEQAAVRQLSDSNGWAVADAARMLQQYGSASTETALWSAFERWHEQWKNRAAELHVDLPGRHRIPWDEAVEQYVSDALMSGSGWLMDSVSEQRLLSLCVTQACKADVANEFQGPPAVPEIHVRPSPLPGGEPIFMAYGKTSSTLSSQPALHRWLSRYAAETRFIWHEFEPIGAAGAWRPGEADALFEDTRRFVESRGMTIARGAVR